MEALADGNACVNPISIDFEKAFNRMGHTECLRALKDHGTSNSSIKLSTAFLLIWCPPNYNELPRDTKSLNPSSLLLILIINHNPCLNNPPFIEEANLRSWV